MMGYIMADQGHVYLNFDADKIEDVVLRQHCLRRELEKRAFLRSDMSFFHPDSTIRLLVENTMELKEDKPPVLYSAGGMVPSIPLCQNGNRIIKENWQHYVIKNTAGQVIGDTTNLATMPFSIYGNVVLENPMENGRNTKKQFITKDYIRILISHGSINYGQSGYNGEGNPGTGYLAEEAAQHSKGGLNLICNEKGSLFEDFPGLFDKKIAMFDQFATMPEDKELLKYLDFHQFPHDLCLFDSLGKGIDIINHNAGETLYRLIKEANRQHEAYISQLEAAIKEDGLKDVFIAGSSKESWAKEVASYCRSKGLSFVMAGDMVDPDEDIISYLRLSDRCKVSFLYQSLAQNEVHNPFLAMAASGYSVMKGQKIMLISEPALKMRKMLLEHPEFGDPTVVQKDETLYATERFDLRDKKREYNIARLTGEFAMDAPNTDLYLPKAGNGPMINEKVINGRTFQDLRQLVEMHDIYVG